MIFQIVFKHHVVDEARVTLPVVFLKRIGKSDVEREILVVRREFYRFSSK